MGYGCRKSISALLAAINICCVFLVIIAFPRLFPSKPVLDTANTCDIVAMKSNQKIPALPSNDSPSNKCSKVRNLAFLKVHKCGGSTIANILQRFVTRNHLNVVLPNKDTGSYGFNHLGHNRNFTMKSVIPIPRNETYNVICHHVEYNRTMFKKLLPKDAPFFAIVRDPEERFVSAAFYYQLVKDLKRKVKGFNRTNYIFTEWLKNPLKYTRAIETNNHMAYDFGISEMYFHNSSYVDEYIRSLDSDFDFILLMDYFDESLMLLRRKLCWSLKDMVYLRSNSGQNKVDFALSEEDRKQLRKWQMADVAIFEHFRARFWRQVESEGRELFQETAFFKQILRTVRDYCKYGMSRWPSVDIVSSPWSESFNVTVEDCKQMKTGELEFVAMLQKSAWAKYNASLTRS